MTAPIDPDFFSRWRQSSWCKRGEEYETLKERMAAALIELVESTYPGFAALIDFVEVATPLSTEFFTSHKGGAIYGIAGVPDRYSKPICRVRTPIKNLFLTGSDAAGHGVAGAAMGAVMAASVALGESTNFLKLLSEMDQYSNSLHQFR